MEISEATLAVYLESLQKLTAEQARTVTARTIEDWGEASKMPPLPFILARTAPLNDQRMIANTRRILDRPEKPDGWEPVTPEEIESWRAQVATVAESKSVGAVTPGMVEAERIRIPYEPSEDTEFEAMRKRQLERRRRPA